MSTLTITTIQSKLHWEDKNANLKMFEEKIYGLTQKTEIIVLPEMFNTGFSMKATELAELMDGPTVEWMRRIAKDRKVILTGSLIIKEQNAQTGGNDYFNRLIWMLPNGDAGHYDKRHRFAYAGEDKEFTAGKKRLIASVKGWRINCIICYDLRFPVWSRQVMSDGKPEYDLMICVANWPNRRNHAWKTLLQARAIENQCYVVGVNRVGDDGNGHHYSGDTLIAGPLGELLYHKEEDEDINTITLKKSDVDELREKLPFWKDADEFIITG